MHPLKKRLQTLETYRPNRAAKVVLDFDRVDERMVAQGLVLCPDEAVRIRALVRTWFKESRNGNA